MAAVGLGGVTAFEGLRRIGPLAGRRILVTGAAGGVGSAATAIACAQNAAVIGLVSRSEQVEYVRGLGAGRVIVFSKGEPPSLDAEGVDGVLDAVGGELFGPCVQALRAGGVLSLVGAVAGGQVHFDAWHLIRPVVLTGYSSESLDGQTLRNAVSLIAAWLCDGTVKSPARTLVPMAEAAEAHAMLERGGVRGRILLVP
jgi:NADPH2:quinone reductase